jgi:Domain of unknown function (DUF4136)
MKAASIAFLPVVLVLGACTVPTGPVDVTVFNRVAEGQTYGSGSFSVTAAPEMGGGQGLSLSPYLAAVSREMGRIGYAERASGSDVVAEVRVTTSEITGDRRSPVSVGVGGSTGSYGSGVGLGVGINLGGGSQARIETLLSVRILRSRDNLVIWEGRAAQVAGKRTPAAQPGIAASKLAEALFKDFPGKSGTTISVP